MLNPVALAVPFFFLLIGIELLWAKWKGVTVYRFTDAITDLSCGITSQILLLLWATLQLAIYAAVYDHVRILTLSRYGVWVPIVVAFVGVDFLYYWWHRLSHEVNFLWAAHVVHHQSEDYNLAVALRQAVLTSWTAIPFYLPLAVLGVPTTIYALVHAASTLYQFWIHTELVKRMRGPIDLVINLPSHHRVHHAINPEYLDKNYGATLIVWDRLFGTFAEEIASPVYGITKPLRSFNPLWAQVHYWIELADLSRLARGWDKVRVWFASPAWRPRDVPKAEGGALPRMKYDAAVSSRLRWYVGIHYALTSIGTFAVMMWHAVIPALPLALAGASLLGGLVAFGGLFERRGWAVPLEISRLAVGAAAIVVLVLR